MNRARRLVREVAPPFLWKLGKRIAARIYSRNYVNSLAGCERSDNYYDDIYERSEEYRKHYSQSRYYFMWCVIADRLHAQPHNVVFDVGCGPGQFAALLRDKGLQRYVGLDFSKETIRLAKMACPEFEFVQQDAFMSELFDELPYDIFVCTELLEHVDNDRGILGKVRGGTRVFGSVPNFGDPGHVRFFEDPMQVHDRYSEFLDGLKVDCFRSGGSGRRFFLFEGRRK